MTTQRRKREWYWDGFRDALLYGTRGIGLEWRDNDSHTVAYSRGHKDGTRAVERIRNNK